MLVTNHVLSGAVLGSFLPGPRTAFVAGVASHFALDALPHWGDVGWEQMLPVAYRDGLAGLAAIGVLTALASPQRRTTVMAGIAGACLPDLDKPSKLFFGRSPFPGWVDAFHNQIQREADHRMRQELVVGAALSVVAAVVVRRR